MLCRYTFNKDRTVTLNISSDITKEEVEFTFLNIPIIGDIQLIYFVFVKHIGFVWKQVLVWNDTTVVDQIVDNSR